jgi:phosphatidylcholine synthase
MDGAAVRVRGRGAEAPAPAGRARHVAAWGVHLFTATSGPAGLIALLATVRGDASTTFWWLAYAMAVDAIDGTFARAVRVKEVLPYFDGTLLDNIVDYLTYVVVPAFFLVKMDLLPAPAAVPLAVAITLSSAYGFCRTDAKTADHFFTGFPSYWNIVAFYLYVLRWSPAVNAIVIATFVVGVFIPVRYLYPSRTVTLRPLTVGLGLVWSVAMLWVLVHVDAPSHDVVQASLFYPVYYLLLSLALTMRRTGPDPE